MLLQYSCPCFPISIHLFTQEVSWAGTFHERVSPDVGGLMQKWLVVHYPAQNHDVLVLNGSCPHTLRLTESLCGSFGHLTFIQTAKCQRKWHSACARTTPTHTGQMGFWRFCLFVHLFLVLGPEAPLCSQGRCQRIYLTLHQCFVQDARQKA